MAKREVAVLFGGEPRLFFTWNEDRFGHFLVDLKKEVVLQSCHVFEVHSPVFTEIHEQDGLTFLSGNAGDSFWSMSVSEFANTSAPGGLTFEVACRVKKPTKKIGSMYSQTEANQDQLVIKHTLTNATTSVEQHSDRVSIFPNEQPATFPHTIQYSYDIYFLDNQPFYADFPK